ncbi:MAG: thioredoxin domain-containing protein [Pseudomonadota bacterium]
MPNRLADATSPYLQQHADNPVDWWTWGPEALAHARKTNTPILLSVGYAACHWCHVMAHESFEDEATAALMNQLFVNIKVDREERPDVDAIYMAALHTLGEQGGWPLTMFLTPDGRPFFGGTYFPDKERYGRPSFQRVLQEIARIFVEEPQKVSTNAELITSQLGRASERTGEGDAAPISIAALQQLASRIVDHIDAEHGGLQGAPKFPQFSLMWFLWRAGIAFDQPDATDAVLLTLERICNGGIFDHLGGGFARYAVDERWLVPHFEKMLYDNAQLVILLTEAWRERQDSLFAMRIAETLDWLAREMTLEGGGFASSLDADTEGEEGLFYVWSEEEIRDLLPARDADLFCEIYDVTPDGNWEGKTILNRLSETRPLNADEKAQLAQMRETLWKRRNSRTQPAIDDKILADWNGLMIVALCRAAQSFNRADWMKMARRAFDFVSTEMVVEERLEHAWRGHRSGIPGMASDYANMIWAALELHQASGASSYLDKAEAWQKTLDVHYWLENGGYAITADDAEALIVRTRAAHDDAVPNANAVMISNLSMLFQLTGTSAYRDRAEAIAASFANDVARNQIGHTGMATGLLELQNPQLLAIVGNDPSRFDSVVDALSLPGMLTLRMADTTQVPDGHPLAGKNSENAAAFVCTGGQCSLPITESDTLEDVLRGARAGLAELAAH